MINSEFLSVNAKYLAERVVKLVGVDASLANQIETAYWLALSRDR